MMLVPVVLLILSYSIQLEVFDGFDKIGITALHPQLSSRQVNKLKKITRIVNKRLTNWLSANGMLSSTSPDYHLKVYVDILPPQDWILLSAIAKPLNPTYTNYKALYIQALTFKDLIQTTIIHLREINRQSINIKPSVMVVVKAKVSDKPIDLGTFLAKTLKVPIAYPRIFCKANSKPFIRISTQPTHFGVKLKGTLTIEAASFKLLYQARGNIPPFEQIVKVSNGRRFEVEIPLLYGPNRIKFSLGNNTLYEQCLDVNYNKTSSLQVRVYPSRRNVNIYAVSPVLEVLDAKHNPIFKNFTGRPNPALGIIKDFSNKYTIGPKVFFLYNGRNLPGKWEFWIPNTKAIKRILVLMNDGEVAKVIASKGRIYNEPAIEKRTNEAQIIISTKEIEVAGRKVTKKLLSQIPIQDGLPGKHLRNVANILVDYKGIAKPSSTKAVTNLNYSVIETLKSSQSLFMDKFMFEKFDFTTAYPEQNSLTFSEPNKISIGSNFFRGGYFTVNNNNFIAYIGVMEDSLRLWAGKRTARVYFTPNMKLIVPNGVVLMLKGRVEDSSISGDIIIPLLGMQGPEGEFKIGKFKISF